MTGQHAQQVMEKDQQRAYTERGEKGRLAIDRPAQNRAKDDQQQHIEIGISAQQAPVTEADDYYTKNKHDQTAECHLKKGEFPGRGMKTQQTVCQIQDFIKRRHQRTDIVFNHSVRRDK